MNKLPKNQGQDGKQQQQNEYQIQLPHFCQQIKKSQSQKDTENDLSSKLQYIARNSPISGGQTTLALTEKCEEGINWTQQVLLDVINQQNLNQSKKNRSVFQNFQKHLITTLKVSISLQSNFKNDPTIHLAHRMWNIFVKTNYYSKKILHFLFGVKSDISPHLEPTIHPHFNCIAAVYPKEEIQLAQQYLREQVVSQGNKLKSVDIFENRRIRRGQEFQSYFFKFIEQLQNGGISRRLSKRLKIGVKNLSNEERK